MSRNRRFPSSILSAALILALIGPFLGPHAALAGVDPGFKPETRELLPYEAQGFRYLVIGSNALPPKGWETAGFNDSGWKTGAAGFGSEGYCPDPTKLQCTPPACALEHSVGTFWQPNSRLLLRRKVEIPQGAKSVRLLVAVDNDVLGVFLNGKAVPGYHYHEGCPTRDQFRFDIPSALVKPGMNLLAVQLQDRGGASFADVSLLADYPLTTKTVPVCSTKQTWTWKFINEQQQGLAGKDLAGHRIGGYPAERTFLSIDTWYPRSGYKETLCGQLHHFNFYHSGIANEDDWNNYFKPNLSHQTLLFEPLFANLKTMNQCLTGPLPYLCDVMSDWHKCNGIPVTNPPPGGPAKLSDCMEAEIEAHGPFRENPWFPKSKDASPLEGCDLCTYGAYVLDCWHGCRPEIHPSELIWWQATPQGTCVVPFQQDVSDAVANGDVDVRYVMLQNDDSDRFADVGDYDGFAAAVFVTPPLWWRPWAGYPSSTEVRYAFEIIGPADTVTPHRLSIQQLDARSVQTAGDPVQRLYDPVAQQTQELKYNGKTVVRVSEQKASDKDLGVHFTEVCRNSMDTRLQGYVSIHSSVGGGGRHVLALVSRGQVLDLSPPQKGTVTTLTWAGDDSSTGYVASLGKTITDYGAELREAGAGGGEQTIESVSRVDGEVRMPLRFERLDEAGRYKVHDLDPFETQTVEVTLADGTVLTTVLPGLALAPVSLPGEVSLDPGKPDDSAWHGLIEAAGGEPHLYPPELLRPRRVRSWHFEAWPSYSPRREGKPAREEETNISRALHRAILNGSREELRRLFGSSEPFEASWSAEAFDLITGEPIDMGEEVAFEVSSERFPGSDLSLYFPPTDRLIQVVATAVVSDSLGHESPTRVMAWNHVLAAESPDVPTDHILDVIGRAVDVSWEEVVEAERAASLEDTGFVGRWVESPLLATAMASRASSRQALLDGRIDFDELRDLLSTLRPDPERGPPDEDRDGRSDFIDLCPGEDDTADADHDGYPDCIDNCPRGVNPDQTDSDQDGRGDECDG